jgi:nicotinate-nucleotide adenylyltransferase
MTRRRRPRPVVFDAPKERALRSSYDAAVARPIGLLGGTFDPVHNGHVVLGTLAVEKLGLERLIVVPARQSPHKTGQPATAPEVRLALLRLAFAGAPAVEISDVELKRPPPSFTIDTVATMERLHPGRELVLLLGLDALADFPWWKDAAKIASACRLAVFRRPGRDAAVLEETRRALPGLRAEILDTPAIDVSSTLVRERARDGLSLTGLVPERVAAEIARLGLYARR